MKRIWQILIVLLVVLAVVFFVSRPGRGSGNTEETATAPEVADPTAVSEEPAVPAEPAETPTAEAAPEETPGETDPEADAEESEYVEDYSVELGDDEVFEIG